MADRLHVVREAVGAPPSAPVSWAGIVPPSGRGALGYGPKIVHDPVRVVALNANNHVRDSIGEAYRDPRHKRPLARRLLCAPGNCSVSPGLPGEPHWPLGLRRIAAVARHLVDRLAALRLLRPLRPDPTLLSSLESHVERIASPKAGRNWKSDPGL